VICQLRVFFAWLGSTAFAVLGDLLQEQQHSSALYVSTTSWVRLLTWNKISSRVSSPSMIHGTRGCRANQARGGDTEYSPSLGFNLPGAWGNRQGAPALQVLRERQGDESLSWISPPRLLSCRPTIPQHSTPKVGSENTHGPFSIASRAVFQHDWCCSMFPRD
jgi:hypothetical protein